MARLVAPAGTNHFNKIQDGGKAMLEANAFPYFARNGSNLLPPLFKTTYTEQEDPMLGICQNIIHQTRGSHWECDSIG